MSIRRFELGDVSKLYQLDRLCFPAPVSYSRAELYQLLRQPRSTTFIAEHHSAASDRISESCQIAGFCIVRWEIDAGVRVGHVITVDVAPEFRRAGIGRMLMSSGETVLRDLGCISMKLEVAVDNHGAQSFYELLGFQPTGRIRGYYADGADALVMCKSLG